MTIKDSSKISKAGGATPRKEVIPAFFGQPLGKEKIAYLGWLSMQINPPELTEGVIIWGLG